MHLCLDCERNCAGESKILNVKVWDSEIHSFFLESSVLEFFLIHSSGENITLMVESSKVEFESPALVSDEDDAQNNLSFCKC
jgi:hypothetical protein